MRLALHVKAMWEGEAFRKVYEVRDKYWLLDSCDYYMDNLERFSGEDFQPTEEDFF